MSLYEIRDNNYLQPNRYFSIRGEVKFIEKEVKYTKIILSVFSYLNIDGKPDDIPVHFKSETKKVVDKIIALHCWVLVMGDIVIKDKTIFFDGKIIEVYKTSEYVKENNSKIVDPKSVNYESAF